MSKRIKLKDFNFDDKNFNRHTEYGMELLQKSIEKVGVIESITVSNDNKVISGNARKEKITEVLGEDVEPIYIETDGKRPIILKRTDIESGTKEFHEAAIFANTVSKNNININEIEVNKFFSGEDVTYYGCKNVFLLEDIIESKEFIPNENFDEIDFDDDYIHELKEISLKLPKNVYNDFKNALKNALPTSEIDDEFINYSIVINELLKAKRNKKKSIGIYINITNIGISKEKIKEYISFVRQNYDKFRKQ